MKRVLILGIALIACIGAMFASAIQKQIFFLYQGAAPTKKMIDDGEYTMSRFAGMYGFTYEGMATSKKEAKALREKLKYIKKAEQYEIIIDTIVWTDYDNNSKRYRETC